MRNVTIVRHEYGSQFSWLTLLSLHCCFVMHIYRTSFFFLGEHPAAIQRGISSAPGGCPTLWWLAGVVTLYSSHGSRPFVLVLLILMVLYSKNPSYFATER